MVTLRTFTISTLIVGTTLILASCSGKTPSTWSVETTPAPVTVTTSSNNPTAIQPSKASTPVTDNTMGDMDMNHNSMDHMWANSEEEFLTNMIPHHQEAVTTSKIITSKSQNPKLKQLAESIIVAQEKEIADMKNWISRDYPNLTLKSGMTSMMGDLSLLSGEALDKAYISGMITHHEGAIHMAEEVLEVSQKAEIVTLAQNILTTQASEIKELKHLLEDLGQPAHND